MRKIGILHKFVEVFAVAIAVAALWSCSADAEFGDMMGSSEYITAFGLLSDDHATITTDAGVRLHIAEFGSQTSREEVDVLSGRVIFNYTILGNNPAGGFDVRLNRFYPLVVKDMQRFDSEALSRAAMGTLPTVNEWLDDDFVSLLEAPYMPSEVSLGGGYVNVNVCYLSTKGVEERIPEVNLHYDVESSTEDTAVMQLVGSAYDDMHLMEASVCYLWFSFRITEEIAEEVQGVGIYAFYWRWWKSVVKPSDGVMEYVSLMSNDTFAGEGSGRTTTVMLSQ